MYSQLLASALLAVASLLLQKTPETYYLDQTEMVVSDTSKSAALHLHVINTIDSLLIVEEVHTSCGCVMATPQRTVATKTQPADIYIGVLTAKVSTLQPITVDIYTNRNRTKPLRLYIRKEEMDSLAVSPKK